MNSLKKTPPKIILASTSPYRRALLDQLQIPFLAAAPQVDEDVLKKELTSPLPQWPLELAKAKAHSLISQYPDDIIIGSDQMAFLESTPIDKPKSNEEAQAQLEKLSGHTHQLVTGLAVWHNETWHTHTSQTSLKMHSLSKKEISTYILKDQPVGCAGGYKIEKCGPLLFESIVTDDHNAIIGLPILGLGRILRQLGMTIF